MTKKEMSQEHFNIWLSALMNKNNKITWTPHRDTHFSYENGYKDMILVYEEEKHIYTYDMLNHELWKH
jgi:hypothetical protein